MITVIAYAVGALFAACSSLAGLYFSLRGSAVRAEHRLTSAEQQISNITGRLDRDREDSRDWRNRIENSLQEQTKLLRELADRIK